MKIVVPKMKNLLERDVISPKSPEETLLSKLSFSMCYHFA